MRMPTRKTDPPSKENNEKGSNVLELTALARTDQFEEAATKTTVAPEALQKTLKLSR